MLIILHFIDIAYHRLHLIRAEKRFFARNKHLDFQFIGYRSRQFLQNIKIALHFLIN